MSVLCPAKKFDLTLDELIEITDYEDRCKYETDKNYYSFSSNDSHINGIFIDLCPTNNATNVTTNINLYIYDEQLNELYFDHTGDRCNNKECSKT